MSTTQITKRRAGRPDTSTNTRAITAVVCIALATVVSAMSSLNVALPDIARSTHAGETQLTWIIDSYSLVFAALLLPAGALGDRFGRRLTLLLGLGIFGTASAVAMTVDGAHELIALRAVLGLGAALVMPATLSTITGTFSAEQRVKAVSVWAGVAGGSAVLGLLCSGVLLEFWSWRSIFALNVVLAAAAIVGTLRVVPESADPAAPKLDLVGALLAVVGLVAVVFSIIEAPTYGWDAGRTLAGLAGGLAVLVVFVCVELRRRHPLLDPRVFTRRRLSAGSLSIFVQFFAFFGFVFVVLQYLQIVRGDSALQSALLMLPMAAAMMPTARLAPVLVARVGSRIVCVTGLVLISGALVVLSQLDADSSVWLLVGGLVPLGIGMGAAMTPATSAITEALPQSQQGVGSAMNDLARELGGALGIAVVGSVLTSTYHDHFALPQAAGGLPGGLADKARESVAMAVHVGGPVADAGRSAFVDGLHAGLLVGSGAAIVAAILVALLLPKRTASEAHEDSGPLGADDTEAELAGMSD
jgi:EmrB/QacA subfamily drug resistance transporter